MSDMERRAILGAAGVGALAAMARAAGPLNPPVGAAAPSGRTLDEVYNRIAVPPPVGGYDGPTPIPGGSSPVTISQPGSYILTGDINLGTSSANGITITARGVTLDLNGYGVSSDGGGRGIVIQNSVLNTVVRNGRIAGFVMGIYVETNTASHLFEDLLVRGSFQYGIYSDGRGTTVRRCTFVDLGGGGASPAVSGVQINADCSTAEDCIVTRFASTAAAATLFGVLTQGFGNIVTRCTVCHSVATAGYGIYIAGSAIYRDNSVTNLANKYFVMAGWTGINGGGNV